jgi:hypothetical protein
MSVWRGFLAGFGWTRLLPLRDFRASVTSIPPDDPDVTEVIGPGNEDHDEVRSTSEWRREDVIDVEEHGTTGMVDHLLRAQAALGVPTEDDADLFRSSRRPLHWLAIDR